MAIVQKQACPRCHGMDTRKLEELSNLTSVDYSRCGHCQHVWTTDKKTRLVLAHITRLAREPLRT